MVCQTIDQTTFSSQIKRIVRLGNGMDTVSPAHTSASAQRGVRASPSRMYGKGSCNTRQVHMCEANRHQTVANQLSNASASAHLGARRPAVLVAATATIDSCLCAIPIMSTSADPFVVESL